MHCKQYSSSPGRAISTPVHEALVRIADELHLTSALRGRLMDIAAGLTYQGISCKHGITVNIVKTEIRQLLQKLDLHCRHEIDHAIESAELRTESGATAEHIHSFLTIRWE